MKPVLVLERVHLARRVFISGYIFLSQDTSLFVFGGKMKTWNNEYTHSLVPADFSGAVFTCAFFQKCYFYYIS